MTKDKINWFKEIYFLLRFILETPLLLFLCFFANMFFPSLTKSNYGQIIVFLLIFPCAFRVSVYWGVIIGNILFKKDEETIKYDNYLSLRGKNRVQITIDDSNRKWPTYVATFIFTIILSNSCLQIIMGAGTFIYKDSKKQAKYQSSEELNKKITEEHNKIMKKINELELLQGELMKNKECRN